MKQGYRVCAVVPGGKFVVVERIYPVVPPVVEEWVVINPHGVPVHRNCTDFDDADNRARRLDSITANRW